jgi:hypothetical protein
MVYFSQFIGLLWHSNTVWVVCKQWKFTSYNSGGWEVADHSEAGLVFGEMGFLIDGASCCVLTWWTGKQAPSGLSDKGHESHSGGVCSCNLNTPKCPPLNSITLEIRFSMWILGIHNYPRLQQYLFKIFFQCSYLKKTLLFTQNIFALCFPMNIVYKRLIVIT